MSTAVEEIVSRFNQRKTERGPLDNRMREIADQYYGESRVVLPELDEAEKPAAVNLLGAGLDALAMRVASVMPDCDFPALRPGFDKSEGFARDRRLATLGWWDMNKISMLNRKRSRHLLGFGFEAVTVSACPQNPIDRRDIPHWRLRKPLSTYPSAQVDDGDVEPSDCIFTSERSYGYLRDRYPAQMGRILRGANDTKFTLLEYNDCDETVLVLLGNRDANPSTGLWSPDVSKTGRSPFEELERTPNKAAIPLTVVAGRMTLGRVCGVFDQILGMYQRASKLDALEAIAIFRSVFPEQWAMSHPQAPGQVRIIQEADGKRGVIGEIENGVIQSMTLQPSLQATTAIDRLERTQRGMAGLPAEMGGEAASNIRTARRGELLLGSAVDMPIQEHQEIISAAMEAENRRAIAIAKAYWGGTRTSFYLPMSGKAGPVPDFDPDEIFETDYNVVKFSMPGTDANGLVIAMGQRVSMGELSVQTMMEMDPAVEDPVREMSQVQSEGLRRALLQSLEQQATQGQIDPPTLAAIIQMKTQKVEMHLEDCVVAVHQKMQAAQAQTQQQPPAPGAPEQQPGMAGASIPPPQPSQQNLADVLQSLHGPQQVGQQAQQQGQAAAPPPQPVMAGQ